ncbi:ABRE binding factor 4 [Striga asiatica]|uniref:ABRE binding factor 4 n=1 Tax=Striga asiatica TaxID=4170 RepID=A0A5A7PDD9_STRAF|nr:ABRE binding factor 4 [Striga asiatica]
MKRKKWSELEEQTLLSKYSDLLNSGALAKLRTREKKFRPVADHVNSLHHLRDPIAFPFRWSWRDVSIKVQNMRHQYLGVKQKIRISGNEFNWGDGEIHWENFLKYKQVFGDIELSDNGVRVDASNNANSGQVMNSNDKSSNSKTIGDEGIYSDIFGYGDEDIEETDEYGDEGADIGASEEGEKGGKEGNEIEDEKMKLGLKGKKLRMVVTKVLELREAILRREDKRREREWDQEEVAHKREMELERELEKEKRLRMSFQEKWEEREMEWRERLFEVQMQHEKQMMQMHADSCQSQLQILGIVSRLVCQLFGSATDGLGGGIGPLAQSGLQNLEHPAGLGDGGKPDATSPSEFL